MCREKHIRLEEPLMDVGSPLRVQGKETYSADNVHAERITPACAGKSCQCYKRWSLDWDHPCVCREKVFTSVNVLSKTGSPLRVQGKVTHCVICFGMVRITPACAGKSVCFARTFTADKDHPCVCREKGVAIAFSAFFGGSPLRVQGKVKKCTNDNQHNRITPACAGKSPECQ